LQLDKDRIKNSLTEEEIHKILKDLGSKDPIMGNQYQTVCHSGHKHKLYYYDDSKSFHCYTDCSENMDIFEVVVRAKKISFPQAVQYVATLTGKTFGFIKSNDNQNNEIITDFDWINKFKKKEKINTELQVYDERVLDVFLKLPHESWISDGISIETMEEFEIGYYIREEKISIVHRDLYGRFIGLRGRALKQEDIDNGKKYMPLTIENKLYNHMTMMNLYGLHKTKYAVTKLKKLMFFEGEKSVLKCQDYYGDFNFTSAVCSSNISNFHRDIALALGVEEVFIAFSYKRSYILI
jgi:DNA primase